LSSFVAPPSSLITLHSDFRTSSYQLPPAPPPPKSPPPPKPPKPPPPQPELPPPPKPPHPLELRRPPAALLNTFAKSSALSQPPPPPPQPPRPPRLPPNIEIRIMTTTTITQQPPIPKPPRVPRVLGSPCVRAGGWY